MENEVPAFYKKEMTDEMVYALVSVIWPNAHN